MYEDKLRDVVIQILNEFFAVEQGNRVTINNFTTFTNNILGALKANECQASTTTSTGLETP